MKRRSRRFTLYMALLLPFLLIGLCQWLADREMQQQQYDRLLIMAVQKNDPAAVRSLLAEGADPNARQQEAKPVSIRQYFLQLWDRVRGRAVFKEEGPTALEIALRTLAYPGYSQNTAEVIKTLIAKGTDLDLRAHSHSDFAFTNHQNGYSWTLRGETPLMALILSPPERFDGFRTPPLPFKQAHALYVDLIRYMLEHGAKIAAADDEGRTPLMSAACANEGWLVDLLLDRGAQVNARDQEGDTALNFALSSGSAASARRLLARGAKANVHTPDGKMALMRAVELGDADLIREMLAEGANINYMNTQGETPLIKAIYDNNFGIVKLLLDGGADPNLAGPPGYQYPLIRACSLNDIARLLLDKGANINVRDAEGITPLIWAVYVDNDKLVSLLLQRGANTHLTDRYGDTALSMARKLERMSNGDKGYRRIYDLLKQAGAKR